jgi:membrane-associated phospholipid phosphatase
VVQPDSIILKHGDLSEVRSSFGKLRVAEQLVVGFFALALVASVTFPLPLDERLKVWGLNLAAASVVFLLSHFGDAQRSSFLAVIRDWFPCVLIPLAYHESGLFFTPDPSHHLDLLFIRWDNALLQNFWVSHGLSFVSGYLAPYIEFSYLLCYPLVPLGLLSLTMARRQGMLKPRNNCGADSTIDRFWTAVLLAVLTCYVLYPFFPLTPPRVLFHNLGDAPSQSALRSLNLWLLRRNGDQASLFPSGHVASVTATALAVRAALPRVGWVFIIAATSVAAATVIGRYHYAADAAAGALVGIAAFIISSRIHKS